MLLSFPPRPFFALLLAIVFLAAVAQGQATFKPGQPWPDQEGNPIQSHAGGLLFEKGVYYWYGMNFLGPRIPPQTLPLQNDAWLLNKGVSIYSSRDLLHWKFESTQLADISYDGKGLLLPLNLVVRPKVIKNDATGKYIMMAGLISPDFDAFNDVVYAIASRPEGPFRLMGKLGWCGSPNASGLWKGPWAHGSGISTFQWATSASDPPDRIRAFDTTLYKDDDGKAYLITAHSRVLAYELSADYTCAAHVEVLQGAEGEAPAVFKDRGTYYLLASRLTGWFPNRNTYFTASSIHGPWTPQGPFAKGEGEETTYSGQTTFVLPVAGEPHAFIFMADRFGDAASHDFPDFKKATHVWLPIEIDAETHGITVNWKDAWSLSVFHSKTGTR
ncbi:MAG: family 43 glycosylhydrolase [Terracidiphilus sp.]|jgi:hypothetical protein